jgi:uracil-DNA glycosylase family 4
MSTSDDRSPEAQAIAPLEAQIISCRACPRLVDWREKVAAAKRRAYIGEDYWGLAVPGFGDSGARLLVLGLAPAAHGANRTGRVFTGDRSGEWLYAALHRAGFSSGPRSVGPNDGLTLHDAYITASVKCAPPDNKPLPEERSNCERFLDAEFAALRRVRVIVCLGSFAWENALRLLSRNGLEIPRPKPRFGHLACVSIGSYRLIGSYHPSQQNTFTGVLTVEMFDRVFEKARVELAVPATQRSVAGGR